MLVRSEYIHFKKGLQQVPPIKLDAFKMSLKRILEVNTDASLSRHANGITPTSTKKIKKIGDAFVRIGILNWKGKKVTKKQPA